MSEQACHAIAITKATAGRSGKRKNRAECGCIKLASSKLLPVGILFHNGMSFFSHLIDMIKYIDKALFLKY